MLRKYRAKKIAKVVFDPKNASIIQNKDERSLALEIESVLPKSVYFIAIIALCLINLVLIVGIFVAEATTVPDLVKLELVALGGIVGVFAGSGE